jgi:ribonuclease E
MLIDASHPEETRVVVQRGNRIDEFDYESASRRQLRGNIYLAKVTRVEPSLQAAFVEYGGNRHGFLAFSEIHPDYYQIPVADRQALLEEEARFAEREEQEESGNGNGERRGRRGRRRRGGPKPRSAENGEAVTQEAADGEHGAVDAMEAGEAGSDAHTPDASAEGDAETVTAAGEAEHAEAVPPTTNHDEAAEDADDDEAEDGDTEEEEHVEQVGGGGSTDTLEDMREQRRSFRPRRQYKIQEVIKRRQILLVQVVKEERGNKGAALTTYLSLAGRYCVLMPNTARGGGISRKITNSADRRRLKELASDLDVPEGMGVILRTAGASRTMPEIKRDFEYLMRVWEQVRETTLQSVAPTLVYEEGSLIKRSLRDLFGKEVDEVIVAGDDGYREARDFMKMLMPSQVKAIKPHREAQPLFARYSVESQLDAMFQNTVTLRSGGYIVINPTEALVSIDVNSGRSTREHNIEDTALKTNLEAAEEVARQLRLRDLAGLIVIDFIDMEEHRNNRTVEKRLKDCLKNDRARIQVGRISAFGLMEMSRQRMRTGVLESSTTPCPHCGGSGFLRATSSVALLVLRGIEDALLKNAQFHLSVKTRTEVALYILNQKRLTLRGIEERFGVTITVLADDSLHGVNYFTMERGEPAPEGGLKAMPAPVEEVEEDIVEDEIDDVPADREIEAADDAGAEEERDGDREGDREGGRRGRRRRRRGGRGREERFSSEAGESAASGMDGEDAEAAASEADGEDEAGRPAEGEDGEQEGQRRRRRGRRGGRRNRRDQPMSADAGVMDGDAESVTGTDAAFEEDVPASEPAMAMESASAEAVSEQVAAESSAPAEDAPQPKRRGRTRKAAAETADAVEAAENPEPKPRRGRARKAAEAAETTSETIAGVEETQPLPATEAVVAAEPTPPAPPPAPVAPVIEPEVEDPNRPKRSGWWSRAKKAIGG